MNSPASSAAINRPAREIAVFAKVPQAGAVKTRLIPALGAEGAAALQARLITRTLATAHAVPDASVTLWLSGPIESWAVPPGQRWEVQRGADLGARMHQTFLATLARSRVCVLIGTDCPALHPAHLLRAFSELEQHDVVVVPAEDGGYVLIALKAPQPALFEGIEWGRPTVLQATRARIDAARLRAAYLPALPDLDTPADLERARREGWLPS